MARKDSYVNTFNIEHKFMHRLRKISYRAMYNSYINERKIFQKIDQYKYQL